MTDLESQENDSPSDAEEDLTESEEKTDREDGGPTSAHDGEGDATGGAHGTKESEFEPHE
jgi:hypothetical protein